MTAPSPDLDPDPIPIRTTSCCTASGCRCGARATTTVTRSGRSCPSPTCRAGGGRSIPRRRSTRSARASSSRSPARSSAGCCTRPRSGGSTATSRFDIVLATALHGRGYGSEALRVAIRHFIGRGHHRFTIDPAADNARAIRTYAGLGFKPVGVLRAYERRDGAVARRAVHGPAGRRVRRRLSLGARHPRARRPRARTLTRATLTRATLARATLARPPARARPRARRRRREPTPPECARDSRSAQNGARLRYESAATAGVTVSMPEHE